MAEDNLVGRRSRMAAPRYRFVDRIAALPFVDAVYLVGSHVRSEGLLGTRFPGAEAGRPA